MKTKSESYKWTIKEIFDQRDYKSSDALWDTIDYLEYLVPIYWDKRLDAQKN